MTTVFKNSAYLLTSRIMLTFIGLAQSIVLSRILGPSNRGIYFVVISICGFLTYFLCMGINLANTYYINRHNISVKEVNSNAIYSSIVFSISPLLLLIFCKEPVLRLFPGAALWQIYLAVLLLPFSLYAWFWRGIIDGINKIFVVTMLNNVASIFGFVITVCILLFTENKVTNLLIYWMVSSFVLFVFRYGYICRYSGFYLGFNFDLFKKILTYGFKGYVGNLAYYVFHSIDIFIVNLMVGASGVGLYTLSVQFAEKNMMIPLSISEGATPHFGKEMPEENKIIAKVSRHVLITSLLSTLPLIIFTPIFIPIVYGKEYLGTLMPFFILLPGSICLALAGVYSAHFSYKSGNPIVPSVVSWISLLIYLPLTFLFIKLYGISGAALSSSVTYVFIFVVMLYLYCRDTNKTLADLFVFTREDLAQYVNGIKAILSRINIFKHAKKH